MERHKFMFLSYDTAALGTNSNGILTVNNFYKIKMKDPD